MMNVFFLGFAVDEDSNIYYLNREQRLEMKKKEKDFDPDCSGSIEEYFKLENKRVMYYSCSTRDAYFKVRWGGGANITPEIETVIRDFLKNLNFKDLVVDSHIALSYCNNIEDDSDVRELITDVDDILRYLAGIKDDKKMRDTFIQTSKDALKYCIHVNPNRKPIIRKITDPDDAKWYCDYIKNDPEVRKIYEKT